MKDKKLIHFDFDGVIVDTFGIAYETHKSLTPNDTEDDYRMFFTGNVFKQLRASKSVNLTEEHKIEYNSRYEKKLFLKPPIDGMPQVLQALSKGHKLNIISSTCSSTIKEFLVQNHLVGIFGDVLGADFHESKHEKILHLLEKNTVAAQDSVMITDTLGDIMEANEVNVPSIAVTWGFHSRELLQKGNPTAIVDTPEQLLKLFI